jgi:hypothetical protein
MTNLRRIIAGLGVGLVVGAGLGWAQAPGGTPAVPQAGAREVRVFPCGT